MAKKLRKPTPAQLALIKRLIGDPEKLKAANDRRRARQAAAAAEKEGNG